MFSVIFMLPFMLFAQESMEYIGAIKLNDTTAITYRLVFEENSGKISGYSLTDFNGEHETKSLIEGTYDEENKLLSFHETNIVYTKSSFVKNDFCFINFLPVKFKLGKTKSFKGDFLGKFKDGVKCIDGELYLNAVERIEKYVNKFSKKVNKSRKISDSLKQEFNNVKILDSIKLNILKKSQTTSYFTTNNSVKLRLYDGGQIDEDIVSVYVDQKILLYKFEISEKEKIIDIPLKNKETHITIQANSIGNIGENTAMVEVEDGINNIQAMTNLQLDEKTHIVIIKR